MLVAELQELEEVKSLVTKGQQLGVLTFGDVAQAVSEVELDESDVEDLYGHLEKSGIELVEEPTSADALSSLGPGSVPWFADESAIDAARFEALLAHDPCAGFVLKPTALGGFFAALERTQLARQAKKRVIVSHAFDGPVALAAAAELSLVIGGEEAHGLDVHAALTAFPGVTIPRLGERGSPLAVGVHPAPGLGFELEGRWLA